MAPCTKPCQSPHLFRLYRRPSGSGSKILIFVIAEHGAREGHELEVGGDLANVTKDEMHLLLLAVEGLTYLCTGGLQLTPDVTHRESVLMRERGAFFLTVGGIRLSPMLERVCLCVREVHFLLLAKEGFVYLCNDGFFSPHLTQ